MSKLFPYKIIFIFCICQSKCGESKSFEYHHKLFRIILILREARKSLFSCSTSFDLRKFPGNANAGGGVENNKRSLELIFLF